MFIGIPCFAPLPFANLDLRIAWGLDHRQTYQAGSGLHFMFNSPTKRLSPVIGKVDVHVNEHASLSM